MEREARARLRSEITEGVLTIPGREGQWHQRIPSRLHVEVSDLALLHSVSIENEVVTWGSSLVGTGRIRKDDLCLAGWGDECKTLPVSVRPANGRVPWSVMAGFIPGHPDFRSEDEWYLEAWVPEADIDRMVAAYRAGEMLSFRLGTHLNLWMHPGAEHTPPGYGVIWYMVPPEGHASDFPEVGKGKVVYLGWRDERHSQPAEQDAEQAGLLTTSPIQQTPLVAEQATSSDLAALVKALERLREAIQWVGAALAFAITLAWFAKN